LGKLARSGYCKDIRTKLFQHILTEWNILITFLWVNL
jgi:hypothetical protein